MGFCRQNIKMLFYENSYKPIKGNLLCLAKQSVNLDVEELEQIFGKKYNINHKTIDKKTKHAKQTKRLRITDKAFLEQTFDIKYNSLDISKYEGANIIGDLNKDLPKKFHKKFDFIFSGGVLDNLFNPTNALINISKLLKDNGRILFWEPSRGLVGSMLNFTPEYFYSYFSLNKFADYKVYLLHHKKDLINKKHPFDYKVDIFSYNPNFTRKKNFNYLKSSKSCNGIHYIMGIAEKSKKSTVNKIPINLHYIEYVSKNSSQKKNISWNKFRLISNRPTLGKYLNKKKLFSKKKIKEVPYNTDHYKYLISDF
jgi:SAM-dependent methyltransferase